MTARSVVTIERHIIDEEWRHTRGSGVHRLMVADIHRTLLYGGISIYPADSQHPEGKLRLLYEAAPLAVIAVHVGGRATDGARDVLDVVPTALHQCTPLYLGSAGRVETADRFLAASGPTTPRES